MSTNKISKRKTSLIYPQLSYVLVGVCFSVHNDMGRYAKEKQYSDEVEAKLKQLKIKYKKEFSIGDSGNIVDFLIEDKIILELKAKRIITRQDYLQTQRYLQESRNKLALLVNFRRKYLQPKRIVRIEEK